MTKPFFTAIALLVSIASFGQDYVITMKSDTIKGEARVLSYDLLDRVQVSEEGKKKKTTYTALQVRSARVNGEEFVPVKYENAIRMMKVIRTGYLALYTFRAPGQTSYDIRVLKKIGTEAMEVPNMGFKKFVSELLADCPIVSEKVKNGDYDRYHVENMVDQYNECIGESSARRIEVAKQESTPATDLIDKMKGKVSASDLGNKAEVNDLLTSIGDKVKKKEPVPAYMREGLKGYLNSNEDLKADMEQLFKLIGN